MGVAWQLAKARIRIRELEYQIAELEKQLAPPPPPVLRSEIGYLELYDLLYEKFPEAQVFLSDRVKYLCDLEDIEAFLAQDETNHIQGEVEKMDCDDFTYRLMGQFSVPGWAEIAKGIIWTGKHALMGCIDTNRDFWWIEPQTDEVQSKLEAWQGSRVRVIIM